MSNDSNHYISYLDVIVRSGTIGKSVECSHDNGTHNLVGSINLMMNVNTSSIICMHTSKSDSESRYLSMNATSIYMGTVKGTMPRSASIQ